MCFKWRRDRDCRLAKKRVCLCRRQGRSNNWRSDCRGLRRVVRSFSVNRRSFQSRRIERCSAFWLCQLRWLRPIDGWSGSYGCRIGSGYCRPIQSRTIAGFREFWLCRLKWLWAVDGRGGPILQFEMNGLFWLRSLCLWPIDWRSGKFRLVRLVNRRLWTTFELSLRLCRTRCLWLVNRRAFWRGLHVQLPESESEDCFLVHHVFHAVCRPMQRKSEAILGRMHCQRHNGSSC